MYLFVIYSHSKNLDKAQILYEQITDINAEIIIIYGNPSLNDEYIKHEHIITIKCGDTYDCLTDKTLKLLEISNQLYPDIKGLFKCDDDIVLNVNRFNSFLLKIEQMKDKDYIGKSIYTVEKKGDKEWNTLHAQYCGGPLYYLSKKSIQVFVENSITKGYYEDNCIGHNLNKRNIYPINYPLYTDSYDEFLMNKNTISFHNNRNIDIEKYKLKHVYYINLEERTDRKKHIEKQLDTLGWCYERFNAIKAKSGRVGCSMSHLKLLTMAKEKNLPYIVIIEDDIHFTDIQKFNVLYKHFVDTNIDYDVYLLAGNLRPPVQKFTPHILKISLSYTTTGYIVRQHYYDVLIQNIKDGIQKLLKNANNGMNAIDVNWIPLQKKDKWFISYPRTVTQLANHFSNIENRVVNYDHLMLDNIN